MGKENGAVNLYSNLEEVLSVLSRIGNHQVIRKTGAVRLKEKYGDLIRSCAENLSVDENVLGGILLLRSNGRGHFNGRLWITFDENYFLNKVEMQAENSLNSLLHLSQVEEYQALRSASEIDEDTAYESVCMGLVCVRGYDYIEAGYDSAREMFGAFSLSEEKQIEAFTSILLSKKSLLSALQENDYQSFIAQYDNENQLVQKIQLLQERIEEYRKVLL